MMMGVIVVFSPWRKCEQETSEGVMRDSNEAERCRIAFEKACTEFLCRVYEALLLDKRPYLARDFLVLFHLNTGRAYLQANAQSMLAWKYVYVFLMECHTQ